MFTQFPEIITTDAAEKLWFQDKTIRETKQVYSLEQIWRFLSQEIEARGLIEAKLKILEFEANQEESDDSDLEIGDITNSSKEGTSNPNPSLRQSKGMESVG